MIVDDWLITATTCLFHVLQQIRCLCLNMSEYGKKVSSMTIHAFRLSVPFGQSASAAMQPTMVVLPL